MLTVKDDIYNIKTSNQIRNYQYIIFKNPVHFIVANKIKIK